MKYTDHLLALDARPALRLLALQQLARAQKAAARVREADPEALHDFRVAVRQLRTTLTVFQEHFEGISDKHKRRLAKLGRRTGAVRDAQVGLGMLSEVGADLLELDGVARLHAKLSQQAAQPLHGELIPRFRKVARRLRRKLETYTIQLDPDQPLVVRSFESAVRQSARRCAETLASRLLDITAESDSVAIHRARIAGKRLRYVLAPLGTAGVIADATAELRELQKLLGTLADVDRLTQRVACLRVEADDESLSQLEGRLRELQDRAYGALRAGWLGGNNGSFFERILNEI